MFERMARDWVAAMRTLPEEVDGRPVTTRVSTPVTLEVAPAGSRKSREMLESMRTSHTGLAECLAAERMRSSGQSTTAQSAFVIRNEG